MTSFHSQEDHSSYKQMNASDVNERKEEKIAAARQKLKQFKKESKTAHNNNNNNTGVSLTNHLINLNNNNGDIGFENLSDRSTTPSSLKQHHLNDDASIKSSNQSTYMNEFNISQAQFKEQLQLHVQTIGILVAEKAELQSKLHQQSKKSDKKQEECDELAGRLKASRQKIADLEKLVNQLNESSEARQLGDENASHSSRLEQAQNELSSNQLIVDELRMRLAESDERARVKHQESQQLAQLTYDLKSQLEMMQLKMIQMNDNGGEVNALTHLNENEHLDEVLKLRQINESLEKSLSDANAKIESLQDNLKGEYQTYVDQLRKQVESLVDQINRMSDEREDAFSKIDRLDSLLKSSNVTNQELTNEINRMKKYMEENGFDSTSSPNQVQTQNKSLQKNELLENEIKYFKHQIELLLVDESNLRQSLLEKEQSIMSLEKLLEKYESDREQYNRLLDQSHNDKQTISRILTQNNDLKNQLNELQDVYVNVTNQNLELATKLETEKFKLKHLEEKTSIKDNQKSESVVPLSGTNSENNNEAKERDLESEWDDDAVLVNNSSLSSSSFNSDKVNKPKSNTLMNSIKERLEYLEKENKDLNDYISLINKREKEKASISIHLNETQDVNKDKFESNEHLFKAEIEKLEKDKEKLTEELNLIKSNSANKDLVKQNESENKKTPEIESINFNSIKLLEDKFNKVMKENADLKEKNQELEHVVQQLQFETETIIDYISMYQMERLKLNEKYKIKDESIRSLSTQLQVNKLALHEINNYLNAFVKLSQPGEISINSNAHDSDTRHEQEIESQKVNEPKKVYLLNQIQSLLNDLTNSSSTTLNKISPMQIKSSGSTSSDFSNKINYNNQNGLDKSNENQINPKSIADFRSQTFLCSECYGDLFIV